MEGQSGRPLYSGSGWETRCTQHNLPNIGNLLSEDTEDAFARDCFKAFDDVTVLKEVWLLAQQSLVVFYVVPSQGLFGISREELCLGIPLHFGSQLQPSGSLGPLGESAESF